MQTQNDVSYLKTDLPVEERIAALLGEMTLAEKIGQMTQVEKNSITPEQVTEYAIGSVLSGGGGNPTPNSPQEWAKMVRTFAEAALAGRLSIPLIYGVDAVHGHSNVKGAVIFPHNIGLGAAHDADLVERIGRVTARELLATGVHWTFAPAVSVPQDIRWGRAYEGYSQNTDLVIELSLALLRGLKTPDAGEAWVLPSVKHYAADGGTTWNTTKPTAWSGDGNWQAATPHWKIDQGDALIDEQTLREVHIRPYKEAIDAGALNIMVSFSSWNGQKNHANKYLVNDILKEEFGFEGFIVSDWMAINQIAEDYYECVVAAINAGLDMVMVPYDFKRFVSTLEQAVNQGDVTMERIDDAVTRILRAKFLLGLFENPYGHDDLLPGVGSAEHRELSREAVRKSLVLLKNEGETLPLSKEVPSLIVSGAADDLGLQCGGWTIEWQGGSGRTTEGTTLLEALQQVAGDRVTFEQNASFAPDTKADVGIVVVGETPYAEGFGDNGDLHLSPEQAELVEKTRAHCEKLVLVVYSGRPIIITEQVALADAVVAAWLPGTEGGSGIADVIFGDAPFTGKLSFHWPRSMSQVPVSTLEASDETPLWAIGFGLTT